jgi:outer membrane protein OmpA-like peptidoglycan-associated protein
LLAAAVSACSTVEDWFEDAPPPKGSTQARPGAAGVPGADGGIPNLSSVPGQAPRPVVTAEERKKLVQELTADNKGVQYAEPVVKPEQPNVPLPRPAPPRTPPAPAKAPEPAKASEAPKPQEPAKPVASVQMPAAPKVSEPATTVIQPAPPSTATIAPQPQPPVAAPPSPAQPPVVMQQALPPPPSSAPPPAMSQPIPTPPPPPLLAAVSPPPAAATAQPSLASPMAPAPQAAVPAPRGPRDPRALETYNAAKVAVSAQVGSIPFEANSSRMRVDDIALIRDVAQQQKKRGGTLRVVGFADAPVSVERAEQVARVLLESGVRPERVYSGTVLPNDPAFRVARPESVSANRRVDIYIDY